MHSSILRIMLRGRLCCLTIRERMMVVIATGHGCFAHETNHWMAFLLGFVPSISVELHFLFIKSMMPLWNSIFGIPRISHRVTSMWLLGILSSITRLRSVIFFFAQHGLKVGAHFSFHFSTMKPLVVWVTPPRVHFFTNVGRQSWGGRCHPHFLGYLEVLHHLC